MKLLLLSFVEKTFSRIINAKAKNKTQDSWMNVCGRRTYNEFVNQTNNISRESSFVRFACEIYVLILLP